MKNLDVLEFLEGRRSVLPTMFTQEGPSNDEIARILRVGMRVPDHKKLAPWRFVVFSGDARVVMGQVFADACVAEEDMEPSVVRLQTERARFLRAPVVIGVVAQATTNPKVPACEQTMSAGIASYNICLAGNALGYGTCLLTEWVAYSPMVHRVLGLSEHESVAAFVYIGAVNEPQGDRVRPDFNEKVTYWSSQGQT